MRRLNQSKADKAIKENPSPKGGGSLSSSGLIQESEDIVPHTAFIHLVVSVGRVPSDGFPRPGEGSAPGVGGAQADAGAGLGQKNHNLPLLVDDNGEQRHLGEGDAPCVAAPDAAAAGVAGGPDLAVAHLGELGRVGGQQTVVSGQRRVDLGVVRVEVLHLDPVGALPLAELIVFGVIG